MVSTHDGDELRALERHRVRLLVEARVPESRDLHADDFALVTPNGNVLTKDEYLGRIASGDLSYRRFEPASEIEVVVSGDLAVLRYRSLMEFEVDGPDPGPLECWHLDCYQRAGGDAPWRIRWSQATSFA